MKKYELLQNDTIKMQGAKLYRIRALKDFDTVKAGDLGGYVQSESNLSQSGDCWVRENGIACGDAFISGNAIIGNAIVGEIPTRISIIVNAIRKLIKKVFG